MRICFFATARAVHGRRVIRALIEHGFRVHVVHTDPGEIPGATSETFAVPRFSPRAPGRWASRRQQYLGRFFDEFDVVSVCFLNDWGFTPEIIERGCLALWPWGSDIRPPPGAPPMPAECRARRRMMLRHARAVAACSDWLADEIAHFADLARCRVETVPLGVDPYLFVSRALPSGLPTVGFLKGFGWAYGPQYLVRAIPTIVRAVPQVRFELVGSGPLLQPCRELAEVLGVSERIRWLAPVPHERVPAILGRWEISVIPSVCESFGVAALESSAVRVPVVASDVGGLPETVVHERTGTLVPPGDSDALAEAVIDLLCDRKKRLGMGRSGRQFVQERFSWQECISKWVAFYERAASAVTDGGASA